jgi:hypothetical protein
MPKNPLAAIQNYNKLKSKFSNRLSRLKNDVLPDVEMTFLTVPDVEMTFLTVSLTHENITGAEGKSSNKTTAQKLRDKQDRVAKELPECLNN